jgi:hypothetical protein
LRVRLSPSPLATTQLVDGACLAGYRHSAMPAGLGSRHELGGLIDATFALIPNIEAGLACRWPWAKDPVQVQ